MGQFQFGSETQGNTTREMDHSSVVFEPSENFTYAGTLKTAESVRNQNILRVTILTNANA